MQNLSFSQEPFSQTVLNMELEKTLQSKDLEIQRLSALNSLLKNDLEDVNQRNKVHEEWIHSHNEKCVKLEASHLELTSKFTLLQDSHSKISTELLEKLEYIRMHEITLSAEDINKELNHKSTLLIKKDAEIDKLCTSLQMSNEQNASMTEMVAFINWYLINKI